MLQYMTYIEVSVITMAFTYVYIIPATELHRTSHSKQEASVINSDVMTVLPEHVDHVSISDHVSRSQSHVLLETEQQGRSSFTSQYVANHLQDLIASPSGMFYVYV